MHDESYDNLRTDYADVVRQWRHNESLRFHGILPSIDHPLPPALEAAIRTPQKPSSFLSVLGPEDSRPRLPLPSPTSNSIQKVGSSQALSPGRSSAINRQLRQPDPQQNLQSVPQDPFEEEIQIMSKVVAYLDIATKRIVDSIAMMIRTGFVNDFAEELRTNLEKKLNLTVEQSARFALDDPDVRHARSELAAQKAVLVNALTKLKKLEENENIE